MITLSTRCHHCGQPLELGDGFRGYVVSCPDCTDPLGSSPSEGLEGRGATPDDALQNWFDRREELGLEPEATLSALANFVIPHSPEGWEFSIKTPSGWVAQAETLAGAESFAARTHSHGPLPIVYGPATSQVQKASNQ